MASEARRSRAVLVTPIHPGLLLGVQPRLSSAVRSVRRVYTSFSADMPWPRGPEDERLSGLLVLPSLPMDSRRCDEGTAL